MKIVSLALNVPGPVAVSRLVGAGAQAVKIEPPWGDPLETYCRSWYAELHAGVRTVRIDLKSPNGMRDLFASLSDAAVFLTSHRPSALARLGLNADALRPQFPALRHVNIVGDTVDPEKPGHDLTYQAKAGLLRGAMPATLLADLMGGERTHSAILEVLGELPGSARTVGLFDSLDALTAPLRHGLTAPDGTLGGANPAYAIYTAREGAIAVGALEPHFRARLYQSLGLEEGSDLSKAFATRTALEWERWAHEHDLPLAAIR